jgi:hypothetical protein
MTALAAEGRISLAEEFFYRTSSRAVYVPIIFGFSPFVVVFE